MRWNIEALRNVEDLRDTLIMRFVRHGHGLHHEGQPSHNSVGNDTKPRSAGLFLWRTHLVQVLGFMA